MTPTLPASARWTLGLLACIPFVLGVQAHLPGGWIVQHLQAGLPALGVCSALFLALVGGGRLAFRAVMGRAPVDAEEQTLSTLLGLLPLLIGTALWLEAGGAGTPGARLMLGALAVLGLLYLRADRRAVAAGPPRVTGPAEAALVGCIVCFGLAWLGLHAAAPPVHLDELQYQLTGPRLWLERASLLPDPHFPASFYPGNTQLVYALAMGAAGEPGTRLVQPLFALLTALLVFRMARAHLHPSSGPAAVAILFLSESFLRHAGAAVSDGTTGLLVLGAAVQLLRCLRGGEAGTTTARDWMLAGLLSGLALGSKYTAGLFLLPIWLGCGVWLVRRAPGGTRILAPWLGGGLATVVLLSPWLARAWLHGGHPLYPLAGHGGPEGPQWAFDYLAANHGRPLVRELLGLPIELFTEGSAYSRELRLGRLGVLPAVALPGIVLLCRRRPLLAPTVIGVAVGTVLWDLSSRRIPYFLAAWPLVAALAGAGLWTLGEVLWPGGTHADRRRRVVLAALALAALLELPRLGASVGPQVRWVSGELDDDAYMRAHFPTWPVYSQLRQRLPLQARVAMLFHGLTYPLERDFLWPSVEDHTPARIQLHQAGTPEGLLERYRAAGVTHVLYQRPILPRDRYRSLTDQEYAEGFEQPMALAEEFARRYLVREVEVYNLGLYRLDEEAGQR